MKKIYRLLLIILFSLFIINCTDNKDNIYIDSIFNKIINDLKIDQVTEDLDLLTEFDTVNITYSSSNENIITKEGKVNRTEKDEIVTLYVTFTYGKNIYSKQFDVIVLKKEEPKLTITEYINWLDTLIPNETMENISLPITNDEYGGIITWNSSNKELLSDEGIVTRSKKTELVKIVANIDYLSEKFSKEYNISIIELDNPFKMNDYISWLDSLIPNETTENIDLPITHDEYGGEIKWKSSDENILSNTGNINRNGIDNIIELEVMISYLDDEVSKKYTIIVKKDENYFSLEDYITWLDQIIPEVAYSNIDLPLTNPEHGGIISWESLSTDLINNKGEITPNLKDSEAIIEGKVEYNGEQSTITYIIVIGKRELTDDEKYEEIVSSLSKITILANTTIKEKINFIYNSLYDSEIIWTSSNEEIIGTDSSFKRPLKTEKVDISFQVVINEIKYSPVEFSLFVLGTENDINFSSYYKGKVENLTGEMLKNALHDLISNQVQIVYKQWESYRTTDVDPNNKSNVILLYTGESTSFSNHSSYWNREHVFAKSHGNFGEAKGPGSDIHHLRACNSGVNSSRSNKDFGEGGDPLTKYKYAAGSTYSYTTSNSFEPRDEDKGDVARMMFYMATRYEASDGYDLELNDRLGNGSAPYIGKLSCLLKWHVEDPVDEREIARNNAIYVIQKNRNPFIDYPEFVQMIWGTPSNMRLMSSCTDKENVYINIQKVDALIENTYLYKGEKNEF